MKIKQNISSWYIMPDWGNTEMGVVIINNWLYTFIFLHFSPNQDAFKIHLSHQYVFNWYNFPKLPTSRLLGSHAIISIIVIVIAMILSYPPLQRSWKGVYWFHLVRLSVRPSVDRIVPALYLQQYLSDPFHICTSCQATWEGVSRVMFVSKLKKERIFCEFFVTLTLSSIDLGSHMTQ